VFLIDQILMFKLFQYVTFNYQVFSIYYVINNHKKIVLTYMF